MTEKQNPGRIILLWLTGFIVLAALLSFIWYYFFHSHSEADTEPETTEKIIQTEEDITDAPIMYKNVYISDYSDGNLTVFCKEGSLTFSAADGEELLKENIGEMADIIVEDTQLTEIHIKAAKLEGKVLSLQDEGIELDGYGLIPYSGDFCGYLLDDEITLQGKEDIMLGNTGQQFIVADGLLCGIFSQPDVELTTIRVLIKNSDFSDIYHTSLAFKSENNLTVYRDDSGTAYPAGSSINLSDIDYEMGDRLHIESDGSAGIRVEGLIRDETTPSYLGSFDVLCEEDGFVLINEVSLEDYLYEVVPSEMPSGTSLEALKAQAVCARSYAYMHLSNTDYPAYGAHIDDSALYQVYHNKEGSELTRQAVEETAGQVLTFNGEIIEAYYFSTSCGFTTDISIWNQETENYPYLQSRYLSIYLHKDDGSVEASAELQLEAADLTEENTFRSFIKNKTLNTYESDMPWYRWEIHVDIELLSKTVNENLISLKASYPEYVLFKEDGIYTMDASYSSVGTITAIRVTERGDGGIASELTIDGTKGSVKVLRQSSIRSLLGSSKFDIIKNDGTTTTKTLLPSAFFYPEAVRENGKLTGFIFFGGGYGHGVGMSQSAAISMAENGLDYLQILSCFYEGCEIQNINKDSG